MITRIMCIGKNRINEAMATLSFDYRIFPQLDHTYIFSPHPQSEFQTLFNEFNINSQHFTILPDTYFDRYYDLSQWTYSNWYKQQAFKLCALDHFDSDYFLIQDCDLILLKPYTIFNSGKLNFKAELLWNDHQTIYADMVKMIIGLDRKIPFSLVNELLPYKKTDWQALKEHIENLHQTTFLDAIPNVRSFDETNWFSEYELLGIWKTNQSLLWTYFSNSSQPRIDSWEDFYSINWTNFSSLKFHSPPLKHMSNLEAKDLVKFLRDLAKC
jgi:hypothetical protein